MFAWLSGLFRRNIHIHLHVDGNLNITSDGPDKPDAVRCRAVVRKVSKQKFKPITDEDIEIEMPPLDIQVPKVELGEDVHD